MARQLFLNKGRVSPTTVDEPCIQKHRLLVRVHYSFISSGTEGATIAASGQSMASQYSANVSGNTNKVLGALSEHGISGTLALIKEKLHKHMPLGYSCAGQVVAIGDGITHFRVGDFVACGGASFAHHADMVSVPQHLAVKISDSTHMKNASITTIGAIALQGLRRANVRVGETVCVLGLGLIGQLTVQLAKISGCTVIGIDLDAKRLELAQSLGADLCVHPGADNVIQTIATWTGHQGVDATIITAASKSGSLIQQSMDITRRKGKVVLVGDVQIQFDRDPFYSKEIDFLISCSYGPGRYDNDYETKGIDYPYAYVRWTENRNMAYIAHLIEQKKLSIDPLISQEVSCDDVDKAYALIKQKACLGIVLSYDSEIIKQDHTQTTTQKDFTLPHVPLEKSTENKIVKKRAAVGFVGVGGFAKTKLLPLVSSLSHVTIKALIDSQEAQALTLGAVYKTPITGSNHHKLLDNNDIDAVIIATPHGLHAHQAIDFLQAGKAVFVEKPAATTFDDLSILTTYLHKHPDACYCVDFNRTYAPFIQTCKAALLQRTNPLVITYRVNAGFIPMSHWIQSPEHGGRIIGECCHFLDIFCFLTDAKPVTVSVAPMSPKTQDIPVMDNVFIVVTMSDGSICNLTYTSQGNNKATKEYIEIHWDGKSIILDDFVTMQGFGISLPGSGKARTADKGHKTLLDTFFNYVIGKQSDEPIPKQRIITSTHVTLVADQLARDGGGTYTFTI